MRAVDEAADLVADVVPAARGARWIAYAILGLLAAVVLGFLLWWFFVHPRQLATEAGQSKVDATLAGAGESIATKALETQVVHQREIVRIETVTKEGENVVRSAQGADVSSPGVAAAMHDALCMSRSYSAERDCAAVRGDREGVGPPGADAGGSPPGE